MEYLIFRPAGQRPRTRRLSLRTTAAALAAGWLALAQAPDAARADEPRSEPAADQNLPFARPGPYVGYATAMAGSGDSRGWSADPGCTLAALGGYRLSPRWAAEGIVDYTDAHSFTAVTASDALRLAAASANAKWIMWPGRLQPYLAAGFGGMYTRADQAGARDEDGLVFGRTAVGVDLHLTEAALFNLEANGASGTGAYQSLGVRLG